jgi:single-strand DNA-binding protein
MSLNCWVGVGRLTKAPELKYLPNGTACSEASIALNHKVSGDEKVCYLDISVYGKRAEAFHKYLDKGREVGLSGRLEQQRWEKDGKKHSKHRLNVESWEFVGSRGDSDSHATAPRTEPDEAVPQDGPPADEDDLPF